MLPTVILREGMRIMKKAIVSIAGIAAVVILVAVSAVFFYGSGEEAELTPEQEAELQDMQEKVAGTQARGTRRDACPPRVRNR